MGEGHEQGGGGSQQGGSVSYEWWHDCVWGIKLWTTWLVKNILVDKKQVKV
jgi:hypothetical protein